MVVEVGRRTGTPWFALRRLQRRETTVGVLVIRRHFDLAQALFQHGNRASDAILGRRADLAADAVASSRCAQIIRPIGEMLFQRQRLIEPPTDRDDCAALGDKFDIRPTCILTLSPSPLTKASAAQPRSEACRAI